MKHAHYYMLLREFFSFSVRLVSGCHRSQSRAQCVGDFKVVRWTSLSSRPTSTFSISGKIRNDNIANASDSILQTNNVPDQGV